MFNKRLSFMSVFFCAIKQWRFKADFAKDFYVYKIACNYESFIFHSNSVMARCMAINFNYKCLC